MEQPLHILIMAAEAVPFVKTGEVANVISALAKALRKKGHDARVAIPRYHHIDTSRFDLQPLLPSLVVRMNNHVEPATVYSGCISDDVPIYMISSPRHFGRDTVSLYADDGEQFIFFCRAVLEMLQDPQLDWRPDVIHCHDWQTAIVPNWLHTVYQGAPYFASTATVFTIHRLSHQGIFGYRVLEVAGLDAYGFLYHSDINDLSELVDLMARGIYYADAVTTVSPHYARQIQTPEFGENLDPLLRDFGHRLFGITNGIDTELYDPVTDLAIAARFSVDDLAARKPNKLALQRAVGLQQNDRPALLGMVSRLAQDKGFDLVTEVIEPLMTHLDLQMIVLGVGEQRYHDRLQALAERFAGRLSVRFTYNDALERQIYAGSDMFLMPSYVEPCGLGQMIAMRYGSVPIVRATGGLADTVQDYDPRAGVGNGFSFEPYEMMALYTAVVRAIETYRHRSLWATLQQRGMRTDCSWARSADHYLDIYRWARATLAEGDGRRHQTPDWLWFGSDVARERGAGPPGGAGMARP